MLELLEGLVRFYIIHEVEELLLPVQELVTYINERGISEEDYPEFVRDNIEEILDIDLSEEEPEEITAETILYELIHKAQKIGMLGENVVTIGELANQSQSIVWKIFGDMSELLKNDKNINLGDTILAWEFYAGIGVTGLWEKDATIIKNEKLYEILTKDGLFAMDEHCCSLIGMPYDSVEEKMMRQQLHAVFDGMIEDVFQRTNVSSNDEAVQALYKLYLAAYFLGLCYGAEHVSF